MIGRLFNISVIVVSNDWWPARPMRIIGRHRRQMCATEALPHITLTGCLETSGRWRHICAACHPHMVQHPQQDGTMLITKLHGTHRR
jgi:hypothetical protein